MSVDPSKHPFKLMKEGMHHIAVNKELFPGISNSELEILLKAVQELPDGDSEFYTHNYTHTSISGDRPTPLTEDPYEMVRTVFLSSNRPPSMSEERFRELRNIIKKMPTKNPKPADEKSRRAMYVGGESGAVGGTTVAAGGVVTTGVSAVVGGGSAAAMAAPLIMAAGPAAAIGGAVGAVTGHLLRDSNLSEESQRMAVGGSSGSSAGTVIGAVLGGPIGAAAGGAAGAVVGAAIWKIRNWFG